MSAFSLSAVIDAIRSCLPETTGPVALHEPRFDDRDREYVNECLDTGWVSSAGPFVDRFERMLADITGVRRAVAVVNGTSALHVALQLVGVRPGDEVVVPALTFIATANAVAYCGAIPLFADSDERTLGLDPHKLAVFLRNRAEVRTDGCYNRDTGRPIRAVVPMHTFGHPVDMDALLAVCEEFRLAVVEDAAESLGSLYKGRHTGGIGRVGVLSFNGNKIVTTGGGGAILTQDEELGERAKHLTTTAKRPHPWEYVHDEIGYNYRLPNLNAALGCAQLHRLPILVEQKRRLAERYANAFAEVPGVRFFREPPFARSNYWLNAILLDEEHAQWRDRLLAETLRLGILTRPVWRLLSSLPMYRHCPRMDLSVAESIERRLINLPSSPWLAGDERAS
ncbi:perosamine synthetase [Alicyclobacillus cellulosilyticus]|uniref:Perosamine synthetase n=1 Tax=Alicyclobacillus cellulosilyticus TaxID=1003997 RepID=A0A917KGY8_9BACL|nr:LegC family aminotransferase [Alicyclobacillus cellulosilyticus]GGJ11299.1 perosamine synthetase [Alicyclobacillus cellulosilyticus]